VLIPAMLPCGRWRTHLSRPSNGVGLRQVYAHPGPPATRSGQPTGAPASRLAGRRPGINSTASAIITVPPSVIMFNH